MTEYVEARHLRSEFVVNPELDEPLDSIHPGLKARLIDYLNTEPKYEPNYEDDYYEDDYYEDDEDF